jgi:hypothetical protein
MKSDSLDHQAVSPNQSIRPLHILVVVITLALAWRLGQTPSVLYIFGLIALGGVLIVFRYPPLGLLAIVLIALLVAFSIGTGTQTALNFAFLGVPLLWGLVLIRVVFYHRSFARVLTRETLLLIGLVITAAISLVSGYLPWNAFAELAPLRAQLGAFSIFAVAAAACMLTAFLIDSERWLQALVGVFLAVGAVYIIGRAIPGLHVLSTLVVEPATGSVFWIWLTGLALGQAVFNKSLGLRLRLLLTGLVILIFYVAIVPPESRSWASGWIPAGICAAIILWLRWPRLTSALGFLIAIPLLLNFTAFKDFLLGGDNAYSLLTRSAALQIVVQIIKFNPLLGVGPANYYYYTPLYSILGYYVRFNSHNQYIDILAQTGLVGLIFYLWFFLEIGRATWQLRKRVAPDGFVAGYIAACLGGIVATLVAGALGDWIIPFVYNIGVGGFRASLLGWLFLGGLLALRWMQDHKESPPLPVAVSS